MSIWSWKGSNEWRLTIAKSLVYHSVTGVTQRIAEQLGGIPLADYDGGDYILVFPSYGSPRTGGYVPPVVKRFLAEHSERLSGVIGVGNIIFGSDFCLGALQAADRFSVPLLTKIDMVPSTEQLQLIREELEKD